MRLIGDAAKNTVLQMIWVIQMDRPVAKVMVSTIFCKISGCVFFLHRGRSATSVADDVDEPASYTSYLCESIFLLHLFVCFSEGELFRE